MKIKIIDTIIVVSLFLILFMGFSYVKHLKTDAAQCQNNPLEYGVKKYEEHVGSPLVCSCSFTNNQRYQPFVLTSNGSKTLTPEPIEGQRYQNVNVSLFK